MHAPIFAANWKMNVGPTEARAYLDEFLSKYAARGDRTVAFFPSALAFAAVRERCAHRPEIVLGVQNIGVEAKGAFTGENSAPIARDAGATCVLVGHSERRHVFGETDAETARKCALALANDLTPILCVGETLDERERSDTQAVVLRQLRAGLSLLEPGQLGNVVLAYEPVWAIGTGKHATPEDASEVHALLRVEMEKRGGRADVPILYGGSASPKNAGDLLGARGVDGLLVGGASLDPVSWLAVIRAS